MDSSRRCTRSGCERPAVATLTYSYQDSTIVVGPMSVYSEPHTYDLCSHHADTVNPPRGWEVVRLDYPSTPAEPQDDLLALADAVRHRDDDAGARRAGRSSSEEDTGSHTPGTLPTRESRARLEPPTPEAALTRGHLRLLRD
ncbi:DUF3499 domain-containing protein [Nesterenkonia sp. PF2B19]|uniref:DUF3499 domain-containing protein n=1 Tax=Nesterenkonia sp. PF2B19 TaxID=1881858 RepID=UPI0008729DFB|nr:DUF3499 domain-containing protein [Nesterenkonia sp. PF2B19]OSM42183.1 hypothetical protein BCY76_016015 [Nesterenkonia sp. PF2B19]